MCYQVGTESETLENVKTEPSMSMHVETMWTSNAPARAGERKERKNMIHKFIWSTQMDDLELVYPLEQCLNLNFQAPVPRRGRAEHLDDLLVRYASCCCWSELLLPCPTGFRQQIGSLCFGRTWSALDGARYGVTSIMSR